MKVLFGTQRTFWVGMGRDEQEKCSIKLGRMERSLWRRLDLGFFILQISTDAPAGSCLVLLGWMDKAQKCLHTRKMVGHAKPAAVWSPGSEARSFTRRDQARLQADIQSISGKLQFVRTWCEACICISLKKSINGFGSAGKGEAFWKIGGKIRPTAGN